MNNPNQNPERPQWRLRCKELGMSPQEVKNVSSRYDMHLDFNTKNGGEVLDLPRWYKWYRVEKISEGHGMLTPPAQGCSVGPDIEVTGEVVSEAEFLGLLELYRAET